MEDVLTDAQKARLKEIRAGETKDKEATKDKDTPKDGSKDKDKPAAKEKTEEKKS
jgi:hypothetical protein